MAHHEFHVIPVKRFRPVVERSTNRFLFNLRRESADKLMDNLRLCVPSLTGSVDDTEESNSLAATTIMSIAYDIDIRSCDDHYITIAEAAGETIAATTNAGSYLVDVLPVRELDIQSVYIPRTNSVTSQVLPGVVAWRWFPKGSADMEDICRQTFE